MIIDTIAPPDSWNHELRLSNAEIQEYFPLNLMNDLRDDGPEVDLCPGYMTCIIYGGKLYVQDPRNDQIEIYPISGGIISADGKTYTVDEFASQRDHAFENYLNFLSATLCMSAAGLGLGVFWLYKKLTKPAQWRRVNEDKLVVLEDGAEQEIYDFLLEERARDTELARSAAQRSANDQQEWNDRYLDGLERASRDLGSSINSKDIEVRARIAEHARDRGYLPEPIGSSEYLSSKPIPHRLGGPGRDLIPGTDEPIIPPNLETQALYRRTHGISKGTVTTVNGVDIITPKKSK